HAGHFAADALEIFVETSRDVVTEIRGFHQLVFLPARGNARDDNGSASHGQRRAQGEWNRLEPGEELRCRRIPCERRCVPHADLAIEMQRRAYSSRQILM